MLLMVMLRFFSAPRDIMPVLLAALCINGAGVQAAHAETAPAARTETLTVTVTDQDGQAVREAVVSAVSPEEALNVIDGASRNAEMVQENQEFTPHVLPVRAGTRVRFPNRDDFRHSVYSFAAAKTFQISLFGGDKDENIVFDENGLVPVGCNIHDNMLAYIPVLETDHFGVTDENGVVEITTLVPGDYTVSVWHPREREPADGQSLTVSSDQSTDLGFSVSLRPEPPAGSETR